MEKRKKGDFGYLRYRKKINLIKTIAAFAVVAAVLIIGLVVYKTIANAFTVAAIVLVLPAAKMAVGYFVVMPHNPASEDLKSKLEAESGGLGLYYDLIFSNSKKPIGTQAVAVSETAVIALSDEKKADKKLFETSLKEFMQNDGRKVNVTLYFDEKQFLARAKKLSDSLACSDESGKKEKNGDNKENVNDKSSYDKNSDGTRSADNMTIQKNARSLLGMCL